jgi:hypothetical protein
MEGLTPFRAVSKDCDAAKIVMLRPFSLLDREPLFGYRSRRCPVVVEGLAMKRLHRRKILQLGAGAAALPAVLRFAWAQAYSTRPVRLIIGLK